MTANFFETQPTPTIARQLLGKVLEHRIQGRCYQGLIVETEAYLGVKDLASHAANGHVTPKTTALYTNGGNIYIYQMRGLYLLNFTTQKTAPECVLIRGLEPLTLEAEMIKNRRGRTGIEISNGPGKLCQALAIHTLTYNGQSLAQSPLSVDLTKGRQPAKIETTPRIGIPNKGDWTQAPLRFYVAHNPYVSKTTKKQMDFDKKGWLEQ
ncbi:DNA-3-methyladenine glycosylase [Agrilactobacillus yilanensis]|uniref:Putative 3-methyladenine DNA glycosylase n=1 Tax=Agrilactobacillus yilanensis TaxID=2485997 RepID=A0ABW4JB63_9LACO|nr:DNA-3-methyladenine glycosylase [Agrilactobacillus yilanensis]